jgi:hypothetical protein
MSAVSLNTCRSISTVRSLSSSVGFYSFRASVILHLDTFGFRVLSNSSVKGLERSRSVLPKFLAELPNF